jgi:predicted phage-related endonuclease
MDAKLIEQFNKNQSQMAEVESQIVEATSKLQSQLAKFRAADTELRDKIKAAMEKHNVKKFESKGLTITYIAPTVRKSIDSKKLKEEAPGVYDKYVKASPVASSIRIKLNEE